MEALIPRLAYGIQHFGWETTLIIFAVFLVIVWAITSGTGSKQ